MSIAGVQEQLRRLGCLGDVAGDVDVAQLVGFHRVDLERHAVRPRAAELGRRDAAVKSTAFDLPAWPRPSRRVAARRKAPMRVCTPPSMLTSMPATRGAAQTTAP